MYRLGQRSKDELFNPSNDAEVFPLLVKYVNYAIRHTPVDFSVHDGLRTLDEQREYVRTGVSKTMNSYHIPRTIPGGDGVLYGFAVDLVPYINGKLRWEWDAIYKIIATMHQAEKELRPHTGRSLDQVAAALRGDPVPLQYALRWGGVWDRYLHQLDPLNLEAERAAYRKRRQAQGKRTFSDGPHLQLEVVS